MPGWVAALLVLFGLVMVVMLAREIRENNARRRDRQGRDGEGPR